MEVPLPPGLCQIEVRYTPLGLLPGALFSLSAALALGMGPIRKALFSPKPRSLWYRAAPWLLGTALACALALVYLLPPSIWLVGML